MPEPEWKETAVADLMSIVDWISDDNPAAALTLMAEIEGKVAHLSANPKRGRPGRVQGHQGIDRPPELHRDLCRDPGNRHRSARSPHRPEMGMTTVPSEY